MSVIEKFIRDHREEFDTVEPDPGHFQRFEARLQQRPTARTPALSHSGMLWVAALIVILISVSVFAFDFATQEIRDRFNNREANAELPLEVREVVQYYDVRVTNRIGQLNALASNNEEARELRTDAMKEIQTLDVNTGELKKSLAENPNNERILAALIQNQQMKEGIINDIIDHLSQVKK
ncbi:MAG: hypothetical protein M0P58_12255, partial [Bacteroidales bacterium]|nr:hypothetical protein [Bacteroidales bacterium]